MKLYLIRHGKAEAQVEDHADPPLDQTGISDVARVASQVFEKVKAPEVIFSSPLRRALQTAEVFTQEWQVKVRTVDWLHSGVEPSRVLKELKSRTESDLALVGHLPNLGWLFSVLVWGVPPKEIVLPKGSVSLIEAPEWEPAAGKIRWILSPNS